ncbi:helix-turn-helix domain-containing protein [Clostridium botulinum]|uniref:Helix-turn-helix transcriptional regulator n=1 Tax=Clostridium botulinum TaxID=1491 RepID=A0A6B4JPU8_CLOBO|nr:helix-turn-helix transcriptional regulator [Clostridium botulinum]EES49204.1 transcriptional regulator PuuR [Clostridium botulinum E1 str. 'BoNT E Beluga']MBY6762317.1 helix-turn-helix transcriptional regulator [Clostridium botulinum]MBY6921160.1 helix-turn-helix transcriptional regulator [Clostridium botulinum]MCR1131983.1 helix-turn-helix domain-containing protein [Clostridium botulinum]NFJ58821.1 helix-turn-helix transcriptional regulator [Clostridium botulinum]
MNVKICRIIQGLNQKQLAKKVGTSNVTIVKIEKGNIDNVKFGTLKKIAEVLGTSIQELFINEEKEN